MILVLGLLALIALVGLALVSRTHTDSRRAVTQSDATSIDDAVNGVVRSVRDRLRQDIWGAINDRSILAPGVNVDRPLSNMTPPGVNPTDPNYFGMLENNEGFDKPGQNDRWLSNLLPYYVGDVTLPNPLDNGATNVIEQGVYAYDNVSYIGQDLLIPPPTSTFLGSPFMWVDNSRNPAAAQPLLYPTSVLSDIPLYVTPAPSPTPGAPNLPGSTTNQTIRAARANWFANHLPWLENVANTGLPANLRPQFPYFDTNRDGIPDLYDADGDGLPDSPLSLVLPIDSGDPNRRKTFYAAVRIVDHNAMLNLNTASAFRRPSGTITFDGTASGLTRRGRRMTEILLDGALHTGDWLTSNRAGMSTGWRVTGTPNPGSAIINPVQFDNDVVRKLLLGGQSVVTNYYPFDTDDESSLRHRGRLVRHDRRDDKTRVVNDYSNIDRALRNTNQWSREVMAGWTADYSGNSRWSRLNANLESYDNADGVGWRRLIDEDDPAFVRKPILTTVNGEVQLPPDLLRPNLPTAPVLPLLTDTDPAFASVDLDERVRRLWAIGMNWPILIDANSKMASAIATEAPLAGPTTDSVLNGSLIQRFVVQTEQMPPEWARVMPFDLNMTYGGNVGDQEVRDVKADFIRYAAAAMYFALDGVDVCQGIDLRNDNRLMQEYLAWQFALNLADYRDADSVPTTIEWPTQPGVYITGVERQPFFTEAFTWLRAGAPASTGPTSGPGTGQSNQWYFAVELFVPPGWEIDSSHLYLRSPDTTAGLRPLGGFLNHLSGAALASENGGFMLGGSAQFVDPGDGDHGHYYVFTGSTTYEPTNFATDDIQYRNNAYKDDLFRIATNGRGRVELVYSPTGVEGDSRNVVLDVIGPEFAGGALASNTASGIGRWAFRDPSMPEGAERAFSLRRSTKGWRFTTAWHAYAEAPSNSPSGPTYFPTLGRPNVATSELANKIPESVWPSLTPYGTNAALIDTFASGVPFDAFDSVADLSRQFIIGPTNQTASQILTNAFGHLSLGLDQAPTTLVLAKILQTTSSGDLPNAPEDRVAAGRVDFFKAKKTGSGTNSPAWTWRLFDYTVASGYMYDGVDNDGDGFVDLQDPTEPWDVTFKRTGQINMNTAPATVLRAVPSMSLLPNSPEILAQYGATPPIDDQFDALASASAGTYYDFASAIVALRENRNVPLRLFDTSLPGLNLAAIAQVTSAGGPLPGPGVSAQKTSQPDGAFYGPIELSRLTGGKVSDSLGGANDMFAIDRLDSKSALPLVADQHLAPDYRIRPERGVSDYVALHGATQAIPGYTPVAAAGVETDPTDGAGIRGRDIYLSRVSNSLTTRSDVFTAYIALIDEDGNYVRRAQVTLDRTPCFRERRGLGALDQPISPEILFREDTGYTNDLK